MMDIHEFESNVDQPSLFQRVLSALISLVLLAHIFIPSVATAAECLKTGSVCAEGRETRMIDDVPVTKDCWRYEDTYKCTTAVPGQKACDTLFAKTGCGQTFSNCEEKGLNGECIKFTRDMTCNTDLKLDFPNQVLPQGITELPPTHEITTSWDDSDCKSKGSSLLACKSTSTTCSIGEETRVIKGVPVKQPCWENTLEYSCLKSTEGSECDAEVNSSCVKIASNCLNTVDGVCQLTETRYKCEIRPKTETASDTCKDNDFARAMTGLEGAREFARYFDPNTRTFFNGEHEKCAVRLGGALGGNCCKTAEKADKWTDAAIASGLQYAAAEALASTYTYGILLTESSSLMASVSSAAAGVGFNTAIPTISSSGVGVAIGANGGTVLIVNPAMLGASIALFLITQWLKCSTEEQKTAIRKKAGLCHHVGSYCSSKFLGACLSKKQSYCCYISKLAKIINVQGKAQLGVNWGDPKSPNCAGFTSSELEKIDFSQMDLSEFIQDIQHTAFDSAKAFTDTQKNVGSKVEKASQNMGNYYDQ